MTNTQLQAPEKLENRVVEEIKLLLDTGRDLSIDDFMAQHGIEFTRMLNLVDTLDPEGFDYGQVPRELLSIDRIQNEPLNDYLLRLRSRGHDYPDIDTWLEHDGSAVTMLVNNLHDLE